MNKKILSKEAEPALMNKKILSKEAEPALFTRTLYAGIVSHSAELKISKGAIIRCALEEYFRNIEANKPVENQKQLHSLHQQNINTTDIRQTREP